MKKLIKLVSTMTLILLGFLICPQPTLAWISPIIITEIAAYLPSDKEWIEIYNRGNEPIDLTGWRFYENKTNHKLAAWQGDLIIEPGEYAIIANVAEKFAADNQDFDGTIIDSSWTSLREDGEELALIDNTGEIMEIFTYLPCPETSLQRIDLESDDYSESNWQVHPHGHSAGKENYFPWQKDNDDEIRNNEDRNETENDDDNKNNDNDDSNYNEDETAKILNYKKMLTISELFPNPIGPDSHYEFIELKNISDQEISLSNWILQDADQNSYKIPFGLLKPYQYFVIERKISGIALNNDKETIKLIAPDGTIIQTIKYQEDPIINAGASFALDNNNQWQWTGIVTKGQPNIIKPMNRPPVINLECPKTGMADALIVCDASDSFDRENDSLTFKWEIGKKIFPDPVIEFSLPEKGEHIINLTINDGKFSVSANHKIKISANPETEMKIAEQLTMASINNNALNLKETAITSNGQTEITLEDIRKLEPGAKITTRGIVSVPPGIFGKTTMYLASENAGIQLYMYKADWPDLEIGDLIEVTGELSSTKEESRLKLSAKTDIVFIATKNAPIAQPIKINEINENTEGSFVQIQGRLIEKTGSKLYVQDETGEAEIYIKTNTKIKKGEFKEGDELKIIGIVSQNNEIYQLLPRFQEDIEKIMPENNAEDDNEKNNSDTISKTTKESETLAINSNQKNQQIMNYLIPAAVLLTISMIVVLYTKKKKE